ncbi:hypothetical protein GNI_116300 [Gregarina niphandrodes]|uniref:Transmembrane protein n=1 Tax=Gregarina niphandrodes TaxID=110365 RepID=A0A023B2V8_GRENI|nr:hypothetical protein GNI_116300 [Gregarina niphandrodes]EZG55190.1 hypothetical protein GNI_116300 [Gregarina niphandrodes]|eukprot:XP_011131717.1 hypothetical protein GNI_116300 [Gregarina niphandrodes]
MIRLHLLCLVVFAGEHAFTLLAGGCAESCDAGLAPAEFSACIHALPCPYAARDVFTAATAMELCSTTAAADEIFAFKPGLDSTWVADEFAVQLTGPENGSAAACLGSFDFVGYELVEGATEEDFKAAVCQNQRPKTTVATPTRWTALGVADTLTVLLFPHADTYVTLEGDGSMCTGFSYAGFEMHFLDTNILDATGVDAAVLGHTLLAIAVVTLAQV